MILDTCALLWLAEGGRRLSKEARRRIESAPLVYISAITGFEIGIKYRKGKLVLPALPAEWLKAVVTRHDLTVIPLDESICVAATELPPVHQDPCDRFIIATAKAHGLAIVTADARFERYGIERIC